MLLVEIFLHITRSEKHVQWNRSSLSGGTFSGTGAHSVNRSTFNGTCIRTELRSVRQDQYDKSNA